MLFEKMAEKERFNEAFSLVTIISSRGTVSRKEGRMAVFLDGTTEGTIGGGEHEKKAKEDALLALKEGRGRVETIKVREYGEIDIMIDIPLQDRRICIIGAGHVGKAIYDTFYRLKWNVSVIDTRADLLSEESFPFARRVITQSLLEGLKSIDLNERTAVVLTIPEALDELSPYLISSPCFYVGVLSSRKRKAPLVEKFSLPMGLNLGEERPEEIALSVASEVLARMNKKDARPHKDWKKKIVIVRGAGDLATGVIYSLHHAGFSVIALETDLPTVIRRNISFAECVYEKEVEIEGIKGLLCSNLDEALKKALEGYVTVLVDKNGDTIKSLEPLVVVDAIMAKKNYGTKLDMAPFVLALGPGFTCGVDTDAIIETMRGHSLGSILYSGSAIPNTGVPGIIGGKGKERVVHSPSSGIFKGVKKIGDVVEKDETIAYVGETAVKATISGKLRGLLHDGLTVPEGFKIADIDPRGEEVDHTLISDKAHAIGNASLCAIMHFLSSNGYF